MYTRAVIKELLRFRPPATFVPQMAMADVKITDDYTIPKGALRAIGFAPRRGLQGRWWCRRCGLAATRASRSRRSLTLSA